ncbi:MAG: ethylbenzene dehydrogenase-related protein [bacterium]|nr:ethylbenzene dehydrogenase-related protein [bacterium]MDT8366297.1 ethylbenzene dehydrogenase-related protein [bacterium]
MIRTHGHIITALVMVFLFLPVSICPAAELCLTKAQVYSMAVFTEGERAGLLEEIKKVNLNLSLTDLTREGSSIKLHLGSGDFMEILSNELYSLAVYVPPGLESAISRRSGPAFKVGRIVREEEGVRFYLGTPPKVQNRGLGGLLSTDRNVRELPPSTVNAAPPPWVSQPIEPSATPDMGQQYGKQEARNVESIDLAEKPAEMVPARRPPSKKTILAKEMIMIASQQRVIPLSERISDVGVPPPPAKKKDPASQGRVLVVTNLVGDIPVLDGFDKEEAWSTAPRMRFTVSGTGVSIETAAVTDGDRIYFLFTWPDKEPATRHQPWVWDPARDSYSRLPVLDDGIAIGWVMDGRENFGGKQGRKVHDLWVWRAGREGVGSHASDGRLFTSRTPLYMAYDTHREVGGKWVRMEFDRGRLPFEIVLPSGFSGPEVLSYAPGRPDGSASDVRGVGGWMGGKWVVEMSRALKTEHEDDLPFDRGGNYAFIVNLLQGKDLSESPASEVLTLRW